MNNWPEDCKDKTLGFGCKGTCLPGHVGSPTAVCQGKSGNWAANGGCKPAQCDASDLPTVANATWASNCDKAAVGEPCLQLTAWCRLLLPHLPAFDQLPASKPLDRPSKRSPLAVSNTVLDFITAACRLCVHSTV